MADTGQRVEWKTRLVSAIVSREFSTETLVEMVMAGLDEAYSEGVRDAADICSNAQANHTQLGETLRRYDQLNRSGNG